MSRIANKNPRYRTKDELCEDVAFIVNSSLHYGTKYAVLDDAAWKWTEFDGKFVGCESWSEAAWVLQTQLKLITHEHVIPKSIVIGYLLGLAPSATASVVNELLSTYCRGAVITREQDKQLNHLGLRSKMPSDWDNKIYGQDISTQELRFVCAQRSSMTIET